MARTALNKQAGDWLRSVREGHNRTAENFARALGDTLKTPIALGTLYSWERGDRTVPAAVILASSKITGEPIGLDDERKGTLRSEIVEEVYRHLRERGLDV